MVGAGGWARSYIRTIAALEDVRLAVLYRRAPGAVSGLPRDCRVALFAPEAIDHASIDGLIVATPPSVHAAIAQAALERGVPVLIEKPMTLDVEEARLLTVAARARNVVAMVDHTHLFHPAFEELKSIVQNSGGPDGVTSIRAQGGNRGPIRTDTSALWDWGAHDVAMVLDLMGAKPATIRGESQVVGNGERVRLIFGYTSGTDVEIDICNARARPVRSFSVACGGETYIYDDQATAKLRSGARMIPVSAELPLTRVVKSFAEAIRSGDIARSGLDFGLSVVEILAACEKSIVTKEMVRL